ncbi:hypothetical protein [Lentibacillus cibarius]|uniref:DUF819 family protein n=1 Tax=Lentibacillus cibarius TaxID=2583219 RepID=A0A5S3QFU0_9BACI|nr:hypothetical protein [Lentibacillus cibarius]TMN20804.1 hypothetical protein FFL34_00770 [Lentibacillus cibarius]
MHPVVAALVILALITVGEIVSLKSKARIPMLLIVMLGLLILFQTNIVPESIIEASTFTVVGTVLQPAILVHMGTLIPISVMKKQYKAVLITAIGLVFSVATILLVMPLFFDYGTAVAGAGPLTGGLIAYLVTEEALQAAGLASLVAIPIIVLSIQGLVGMPLTSLLLHRYGLKIRRYMDEGNYQTAVTTEGNTGISKNVLEEEPEKKMLIPEKYLNSNFILLFMIFIGGAISVGLDSLTGINYSLYGLVIGIFGSYIGFYPKNVLERANGFTVAMVGLIVIVLSGLVGLSFSDILNILPAVAAIIVIGTLGLSIGGFIGSKIFKWDPLKGISVTLTAMYGFPGDYLISNEISRSIGRNKEEREKILNDILTPMLIGGFTSVTVGSVVIASLLVETL